MVIAYKILPGGPARFLGKMQMSAAAVFVKLYTISQLLTSIFKRNQPMRKDVIRS